MVFDHGRVVEEGNHEALLRRPHGHYRQLFERPVGRAGGGNCAGRCRKPVPSEIRPRSDRLTHELTTITTIQLMVGLLIVVSVVAYVSNRLKVPHAILLVIVGVALALVPGLPTLELAPEFVLLIVLPPVIYSSAVAMSWKEFRFNLRPIGLLAVGCVVFTAAAAAAVTHWLLGISVGCRVRAGRHHLAAGCDGAAVGRAANGICPAGCSWCCEGEGLANDADRADPLSIRRSPPSSLGVFSLGKAAETFAIIVVSEILWGLAVGWLMLRVRRWVRDRAHRDHVVDSHAVPRLLAARAFWRIRRARRR